LASEVAENARKGIAEASKVSIRNVGFPVSYARYATHIMKFSPARHDIPQARNKIAQNAPAG
jgi:hypothetical protein